MFFGLFGFLFSMILSIFSGTSIFLVLTKSIAGGIILGALGLGLEYFFQRTLSEEDYNSLFKTAGGSSRQNSTGIDMAAAPEEYKQEHKIDLTENADQNTDALYQDMYKNNTSGIPAGSKSGDSDNEDAMPVNDSTEVPDSAPDYTPPTEMHEDFSRLNEVNKEEKIRKDTHINSMNQAGQDSKVSFKLKNKVINADPEIVAKAIKTILHKE